MHDKLGLSRGAEVRLFCVVLAGQQKVKVRHRR